MNGTLTLGSDATETVQIVAISMGLAFAGLCVVVGAMKTILQGRQREQSRREIAAYIAEGSMTPDEGERLLNAGLSADESRSRKRGK